jgi:hypothetical protein
MSIEFIGFLHYQESSESLAPSGATVQPDFIRQFAQVQEEGDFDKALIAYSSASGDGFWWRNMPPLSPSGWGCWWRIAPALWRPRWRRANSPRSIRFPGARLGQHHLGRQ